MKAYATLALLGLTGQAVAFPAIAREYAEKAQTQQGKRQLPGITPGFDAQAQRIDVSGPHAFSPPGQGDQRGPCPGLNALANHNYLPHDGVATIQQFITATNSVFGMGLDLATFLATYGAVFDGNLLSWSIGGPTSNVADLTSLLSQPQGISYSHNKYETDGSPTRGDLYQYGNAHLVQLSQFKDLYAQQSGPTANYDLDVLNAFRAKRVAQSRAQNPYFFSAPFSGVIVQPAAYTFIYRFMANKSASHPEGVLDQTVLKSFFAITGDNESNFVYTPGHERIPENWYRRALGDEYTIPYYALDLNAAAFKYPQFLEIGGNTGGTVNSFAGVDPSDLTSGVYNLRNLAQGNNAACFAFQVAQQAAPDLLKGLVGDLTGAVATVDKIVGDATKGLGCPLSIAKFDSSPLERFPGYSKVRDDGTYKR